MTEPHLFWTVFSAVLAAILLGFMFIAASIRITRMENDGLYGQIPMWLFGCLLLPIAFLLSGFYLSGL